MLDRRFSRTYRFGFSGRVGLVNLVIFDDHAEFAGRRRVEVSQEEDCRVGVDALTLSRLPDTNWPSYELAPRNSPSMSACQSWPVLTSKAVSQPPP
mgnify:CR=1 FL=1